MPNNIFAKKTGLILPHEDKPALYTKAVTVLLGFITFILFVFILKALKVILIPVTIALFLTLLFHPVVEILYRKKIPGWTSVILIISIVSMSYYSLLSLLLPELYGIPGHISFYVKSFYSNWQNYLSPLGISYTDLDIVKGWNIRGLNSRSFMPQFFRSGMVGSAISTSYSLLESFFITILFWGFMIAGKSNFEERLKKAFSRNRKKIISTIYSIDEQVQYYLLMETLIGIGFGFATGLILFAAGVEFVLLFGFMAFILNFIPKIGVIIAAAIPVVFTLLIYGTGFKFFTVFILLLAVIIIINRYVEPYFIDRYIRLSPVFVLFSIIFWGWVWGITGIYLAYPIAAIIKILTSNIEVLHPVAVIISSRANIHSDKLLDK